jgi:hypothetical protein
MASIHGWPCGEDSAKKKEAKASLFPSGPQEFPRLWICDGLQPTFCGPGKMDPTKEYVIRKDTGGLIAIYAVGYAELKHAHIIVDGECASACTLELGNADVCSTDRGFFNFMPRVTGKQAFTFARTVTSPTVMHFSGPGGTPGGGVAQSPGTGQASTHTLNPSEPRSYLELFVTFHVRVQGDPFLSRTSSSARSRRAIALRAATLRAVSSAASVCS